MRMLLRYEKKLMIEKVMRMNFVLETWMYVTRLYITERKEKRHLFLDFSSKLNEFDIKFDTNLPNIL